MDFSKSTQKITNIMRLVIFFSINLSSNIITQAKK
jgi:hypothetical protein